jgi:hypothetical protein
MGVSNPRVAPNPDFVRSNMASEAAQERIKMTDQSTMTTRLARLLGFSPKTPLAPGAAGWIVDLMLLGARIFACVWMIGAGLDKLPTPD